MQFIDLEAQQKLIRADIDKRIAAVLDHGQYIMGPEVAELERALEEFTGAKHCVSCASGTDALLMALMAWGIGPGDAVFIPPFSFFSTAEVVAMLGATPVMVDIDEDSFNMSAAMLEKAIEAVLARNNSIYPLPAMREEGKLTPKAIIPVDLFGQAADYNRILPLAEKYGLFTLEDAAQAFGATHHGKKTCALGCTASATSFFPAKPLGCYGDGGAVFTDDDSQAELLRSIRVHGKGTCKYDNVRIGMNGRMDTIQAAVLLAKMTLFTAELEKRRNVAAMYTEKLAQAPNIKPPQVADDNSSAWAQYCILVAGDKRDALAAALKTQGIPTNIYYPVPLHLCGALQTLGYRDEDMPNALASSWRILALPFHPYMREAEVDLVVQAILNAMKRLPG